MVTIEIPGFGPLSLADLVSDFTGTLSCDGILIEGVAEKIWEISRQLTVHVLTADTCGTAESALAGLPCAVHLLSGSRIDIQKETFVRQLGIEKIVALGNGLNDWAMLKAARLGIVVSGLEGCSAQTLMAADVQVRDILDAFDLLLKPTRCKATLRF